ncbi:MAG TPA: hypothetical protein VIK91_12080 [Nannocystis sp.]
MTRAKQWLCRFGLAAVLAVASATGCTKSNEQAAAQALAEPGVEALLRKIPADTPYVLVGFGGSVRPVVDKIYKGMAPMVDKLGPLLESVPETGDSGPLVRAIAAEVKSVLQEGGIDRLGLDIDGRYAFYGIGGMPAFRWTLKDPQALRDMLARVQQGGGVTIPTCKLGDVEYWCGGPQDVKIAAAIVGDELVLGVAPASQADRVFGILLGTSAPERSLADSPKLREVMTKWGLGRFSAGYVDVRVITEALMGEGDPLNRDVLAAIAPDLASKWPELTPVCKDEIRALAGAAPMLVFGTESISADGFEMAGGLELRSDLARELVALRASVPGLSRQFGNDALFAMGGGVHVGKAIELAVRKAQEVLKSPYQCPQLSGLNRAAEEVVKGASESLPKFVPALRGGALVLQDFKMSGFFPTTVKGFAVLATEDPSGLYEKIRADLPTLGSYEWSDDGSVKTVPDGTVPFVNGIAYGAKAGQGIAIAVGPDSESTVKTLLSGAEVKDPPLMLMSYDLGRMMNELAGLMSLTGQGEAAAVFDFYKMFGTTTYETSITDNGLAFRSGMKLR